MRIVSSLALAGVLTVVVSPASAQGIPVIDAANLVQAVHQVIHDITQIDNQIRQITQLQDQLDGMRGTRHLGRVFDDPLLRNYVPPEAHTALSAVQHVGYGGLTSTAKALRDAALTYNCADRPEGAARRRCQAELAQPYQHKGLLQDAMDAAAGRLAQIDALMAQVDATTDQKAVLEIQARIGAEGALLAHEATQVQLLQAMADSEERIARARDRERQQEMLRRPGRIADHLREVEL